jgi:hypothetical protein
MIAGSVALCVAGLVIVRRFVPHHRLKIHNDIAGPIFATSGVAYGVLLAFVVIIVWQNYDKSRINVEKEANCLVDIYYDVECFPAEFRDRVRSAIGEYADTVVNEEWQMLASGKSSLRTLRIVKKTWKLFSDYWPATDTERIFFAEAVKKLNELMELRRMRILDSKTGVEPALWFVLISGAVVTISFIFFFGSENFRAQVLMAVLLASLLSLILLTVLLFDFPFSGDVGIKPAAFQEILI